MAGKPKRLMGEKPRGFVYAMAMLLYITFLHIKWDMKSSDSTHKAFTSQMNDVLYHDSTL